MELSNEIIAELQILAEKCVEQAGKMLLAKAGTAKKISLKKDATSKASAVVTEIDRESQELILKILKPAAEKYNHAILTEECPDNRERLEKDFFWCIDPLDGTLPYIEGAKGYSVSAALVSRNGHTQLAAVYNPDDAILYSASINSCSLLNGKPAGMSMVPDDYILHVYFDRSYITKQYYAVTKDILGKICNNAGLKHYIIVAGAGSVLNACSLLEKKRAVYFKLPQKEAGGGSLWDFAATECIVNKAGGWASDFFMEKLDLNRPDSTFMNHKGVLFATDKILADAISKLLYNEAYASMPCNY
jgi:3'-phosphoadenosine 5'-phosphosulfate (PAPS) 3'-phosphatase